MDSYGETMMGEDRIQATITSDTRRINGWVKGVVSDSITFEAKVFDKPSTFGIDDGRVSKLGIRDGSKWLVNYDRGWDVKPETPEHQALYTAIMAKLDGLDMVHEQNEKHTLHDRLEAAKEKAALRDYEVTITETLQMKVTVQAKDRDEAEQMVSAGWKDSEYVLDADNFIGADFSALPIKHERAHGTER